MANDSDPVRDLLGELNSAIQLDPPRIGIVLAAGHGQRIRSETSKMLHEIWGRPTVERVAEAVAGGLDSPNQVLVVGIKAEQVAATVGARPGRRFAYQENPVLGLSVLDGWLHGGLILPECGPSCCRLLTAQPTPSLPFASARLPAHCVDPHRVLESPHL